MHVLADAVDYRRIRTASKTEGNSYCASGRICSRFAQQNEKRAILSKLKQRMRPLTATPNGSPRPISDVDPGEEPTGTGKRSPLAFFGRGLAFVVLAFSLVVTLTAFDFARQDAAQHLEYRFGSAVEEISDGIRERMALIEESLHASRAFVLAAKKIGREEWRTFQNNQEIETYHPGTFGVGLAPEIRRADADAYVRAIRRQDQNDYTIWPSGDRAVYAPIRFTASHNGDTRALGLDLYSDPRRRSAMERARDTGKPALSGVVTLVKAGEMEARQSIILFLPVYKQALAADASVDQRRAAFVSYVYCPILIADFWRDPAAKASQAHVAVRITDANGDTMLPAPPQMPGYDRALTVSMSKDVYGQTWRFDFAALPGFADTGPGSTAASVAAAGIAVSFLLFGIVWVLTSTKLRAEAIARNMTRALRDSEGRLRNVVEQSPDAMIMHQDGKIVFVNKAMVRLLRVADAAALIGQSALSVVDPERRKIAERRIQDLYMKKTLPLSEQVYVRADGTAVDVEVAGVPFELDARPAALVTVRDISERKKQEAETERLKRLYAALSQINQAIVWMPARDQLFQKICDVLVGHGGFRMAWIGWHEAQSHRLIPVAQSGDDGGYLKGITIYTDQRPEGNGPAGSAFREGKPCICRDLVADPSMLPWRSEAVRCGFRAVGVFPIRLAGEVRGTLAVYAADAQSFEDKEIALLEEAAFDVSFALDNIAREKERKQAEVGVRRLAAIVESTDDAIIAKTLQGIITDWNQAAQRLFGYTAAEVIGRSVRVLVPPDRSQEGDQILASIAKGEHIRHFETVRMRKDGQALSVSVTISPIWAPDGAVAGATKIVGASTIVRDISERKRAEAMAQTERDLSNAMIESMPGVFFLYDERRRFLRWNRNFAVVSGYAAEEISRMQPLDFFTGEDKPRVDRKIAEVFEQGESSVEAAFVSKDGRATPYFFTGRRVELEGSACLVGMGIDISERRRAEEGLQRFHLAMQTSPDGIFLMDYENFRYLDVNETGCRMLGYSREELLGMRVMDHNPGMTESELRRRFDEAKALGPEHVITESEGRTVRHRDGSVIPIEVSRRYMRIGKTEIVVGIARDITERKRVLNALRASEQEQRRLAQLAERERARLLEAQAVAKVGSWEADVQTMKLTWSQETYRIFEVDPIRFELTYEALLALIDARDRAKLDAAFFDSFAQTAPCEIEHRIPMPDGRVKMVAERWQLFRDAQGQPQRALGTCQDITQRKEAEQALQDYARRLQSVSRQLLEVQENERRSLARELHDTVGQQLTAVSLNLTMVRSAIPPDLAAAVGNRLDDSQKLLEDTTQHLRSVMMELRPPGIDEFGLMAALKEHARMAAERSGFELHLSGVERQPRFPLPAAIALFRIVQEALNNIVKHAQASKVSIELREGPELISLTVADNGRGFDSTRKPLIGVYGMGMTTMRERAEAIGAHLRIESEIGKGTRIVIEVPRTSLPAALTQPAS